MTTPQQQQPAAALQREHPNSSGAAPTMSRFLTLSPPHLETTFWHSSYMQSSARSSDWWAVCLLLFPDLLYFRFQLTRPRHLFFAYRMAHCVLQLSTTLVQLAFILVCRDAYHSWRPTSLWINRVFRITTITTLALLTRHGQTCPGGFDLLTGNSLLPYSEATSESPLVALRHALFVSASIIPFFNALLPLPWKAQLATQLLHLVPQVCLMQPAAREVLLTFARPASLQRLCHHMNQVLDLSSIAYWGTSSSSGSTAEAPVISEPCQGHAADILLLFMQLYVALFLPVYLTYRHECQNKVAFITQLRARQDPQGRGRWPEGDAFASVPILDALVLVLATGQLWVVATLVASSVLPFIEIPLRAPATG